MPLRAQWTSVISCNPGPLHPYRITRGPPTIRSRLVACPYNMGLGNGCLWCLKSLLHLFRNPQPTQSSLGHFHNVCSAVPFLLFVVGRILGVVPTTTPAAPSATPEI